jgi:FtsZ-interacting cell division protein ZipA
MSELQAALLAIGFGVVVAVYAFGWWKQRQYSRKFGAAFKHSDDDALYQAVTAEPSVQPLEEIVMINQDARPDEVVLEAVQAVPQILTAATPVLSEPCAFLDVRSDFIIALHPLEPCLASLLDGLWQRKFDFRKPLQVCGFAVRTAQWERVIAESQLLYSQFRIGLQLVDRGGVISVAKLGDFRDLVQGIAKSIGAGTTIPDLLAAHCVAQGLDAFCAEVDQMVGVNLIPPGERMLNGEKIAEAATLQGMTLESDGAFHLLNSQGHSLVTLINKDTKPFQHHNLEHYSTAGITLMLDVPRVENPAVSFDHLVKIARNLARELQVNLVDDQRVLLTDAGLALIRTQIAGVEEKMRQNEIVPGSAQARRLFS